MAYRRRPRTIEVARYLRGAFSANPVESWSFALYALAVVLLPAVVILTVASASMGAFAHQKWLTSVSVVFVAGYVALVAVMIAASWIGLVLRIGRRVRSGQRDPSGLPLYDFTAYSILGNLVVRRLGPRWRGDTGFTPSTDARPPRTRLGGKCRRAFWGVSGHEPWPENGNGPVH